MTRRVTIVVFLACVGLGVTAAAQTAEPAVGKSLLGFDGAPVGKWTPRDATDGHGVVWESEDVMAAIGAHIFKGKVASAEDLKTALKMDFGTPIDAVLETQTTPKGFYVVAKPKTSGLTEQELIYVRRFGGKDVFCRGAIASKDPYGAIPKAEVLAVCESLRLK
jgi:hypothetical protein